MSNRSLDEDPQPSMTSPQQRTSQAGIMFHEQKHLRDTSERE
ncbi:hypothetical protein SynPROS91_00645 [Synechococcus sp. PROS-9-1]|nr:hypothetical protein SynPROS91_00645 [Synechococcus sp. PROS-9-1]